MTSPTRSHEITTSNGRIRAVELDDVVLIGREWHGGTHRAIAIPTDALRELADTLAPAEPRLVQLHTAETVAKALAIGESTLHALAAAGEGPAFAVIGGRRHWRADDVNAWAEARFRDALAARHQEAV